MKTYYITTPIYYVNDSPHIGHAYTTLACDVLARFQRLDGYRVMFLTGTDEHGQKVEKAARAAGVDPQAFTDKVSQNFRDLAKALNISNDDFIRTTEDRHTKASQEIWRAMAATKSPKGRDNIYLEKYGGWYAVRDEAFYGEDELTTGPDGKKRAPSGAEVEWVEEPSYFFRLSDWQETLLNFYEANPDFIGPASRRNEVISFVKRGLDDLSISRTTFAWGVPVPDAPGHIMYVWVDALTNYITAVGYPDTKCEAFTTFWPADLHMVGKDILRFHAVYWPAFLMAAGLKVQKRVFAHGWWTNEGQKISKSLGNVIEPNALIARYGLDPVRYFMLREVPFGQDGDFSHRAMVHRLNSDLANDLGNLAQRVLGFIAKNADAKIPQAGPRTPADDQLLAAADGLLATVRGFLAEQSFNKALDAMWQVVGDANRYVDEQAPWTLRKTDPARMATVLYVLCETLRRLALLLQPFMPASMEKLLDQLAVPADARSFAALGRALTPEAALPAPAGIFPRFVEEGAEPAKPPKAAKGGKG
jgi:methionyl-tRNA synthetase